MGMNMSVCLGGGMFLVNTNLTMSSTVVNANTTTGAGGGIAYQNNGATARTLNLTNVTISNNTASNVNEQGAGGINHDNFGTGTSTLNITNSNVTGNTSLAPSGNNRGSASGGLFNYSETGAANVNVTNSTFRGNASTQGGGIFNRNDGDGAAVTLTRSTLSNNTANAGDGAGINNFSISFAGGSATVALTNSTVSTNTASGLGGGIISFSPFGVAAVTLSYSTVAANTAGTGGGLANQSGSTITILSSVIADNTAAMGPDIAGTITSSNYNHVENIAGGTFAPAANDITATDPQLGALAPNSGTTQSHLPAAGSPVVNTIPAGANGCGTTVTSDQRVFIRPQQALCEKGSVERLDPSASNASITGRVLTANGRGIVNAVVIISGGGLTSPMRVRTTSFGYYTFDWLPVGETYVLQVASKRYTFQTPSVLVTLQDDLADADFVADPL